MYVQAKACVDEHTTRGKDVEDMKRGGGGMMALAEVSEGAWM